VLTSNDETLGRRATGLITDFARQTRTAGSDPGPVPNDQAAEPVVYALRTTQATDGQPRYSLRRDEHEVAAGPDSRVVIGQLLWQIASDTVELAAGYLLIHAGAVVAPADGAVLILGESGSGKTTLVAALVQEGFGYLSDEAAAIELDTGYVHPWPRPLGFKSGSRSLARFAPLFASRLGDSEPLPPGGEPPDELHVRIGEIRRGAVAGPSRVSHVIDHVYEHGAPTRLEPISRTSALLRMGSAAPRLRREGDRGLDALAAVVRDANTYTLVTGDLDQGVLAVRELVQE
jgi:hypothetical protein